MNTALIKTASGVIHAAQQQGRTLPVTLAIALDAACLLQSPETVAETAALKAKRDELEELADTEAREIADLRNRVAELEAQRERRRIRLVKAEADLLNMRGLLSPSGEPRRIPDEVEIHERVAPAVEWLLNRVTELETQRQALGARLQAGQTWEAGRLVSEDYVSQRELRALFGIKLTAPATDGGEPGA